MEETAEIERLRPIFRDIRRYFCDYCGICRSKKSLITSHIQTHHKVFHLSLIFGFVGVFNYYIKHHFSKLASWVLRSCDFGIVVSAFFVTKLLLFGF